MSEQELKIRIKLMETDRGCVEVLSSPFGESPSHEFTPPLSDNDLSEFESMLKKAVKTAHLEEGPGAADADLQGAKELGMALFGVLFDGAAGAVYRRCLRGLRSQQGPFAGVHTLRLRLVFDLGEALGNEYLARLPWELLYDPVEDRYVARRGQVTLVRDLDWTEPLEYRPLPMRLPVRLLVVDAAPRGMEELDLKTERQRLEEALAPLEERGALEIFYADTLHRMRQVLRDRGIHVLHFMGHGGYLDDEGLGCLCFEAPSGERDQVDGDVLGEFLTGHRNLRLAVLNACLGARHADDDARPAHYGVAAGILQRSGLPAVLAMQHAISDPAAIEFTGAFYERLARGDDVDVALTEARLGLSRKTVEWATPVLFLEATNGRLFDLGSADGGGGLQAPHDLTPRRLGVRSLQLPPEEDLRRHIPHVTDVPPLDLREHFEGRYIHDDALWMQEVYPALQAFLDQHTRGPRPVELDPAIHLSIAYAIGWILQAKSGLDLAVHQQTPGRGSSAWRHDDGSSVGDDSALWHELDVRDRGPGKDVAVALSTGRPIEERVVDYLQTQGIPVGRLLVAKLCSEARNDSVRGGAHAQQLARSVTARILRLRREPGSRLHLFLAAPVGLAVFLGQLGRPFGRTQLYEYDFEAPDPQYRPSFELPPSSSPFRPPVAW